MSAFTVDGELVHYEVLGRGRQVILLHGWIGSWRYWIPTMQALQARYRVYAIDLFGFGDSGKNPACFGVERQVALLADFMRELGIPKTALIGHGLGALVAARFASHYPDRVARLMLLAAPLFDTGDLDSRVPVPPVVPLASSPASQPEALPMPAAVIASNAVRVALLEAVRLESPPGFGPVNASKPPASVTSPSLESPAAKVGLSTAPDPKSSAPRPVTPGDATLTPSPAARNPLAPLIADGETLLGRAFKRSEPEYDKLHVDVLKSDPRALAATIADFDPARFLDDLRLLPTPTVIMHGLDDPVLPPPAEAVWNYLTAGRDSLMPIPLPGIRHFPMLEYDRFGRLAGDFLDAPDLSRLEVKERWRRRTR